MTAPRCIAVESCAGCFYRGTTIKDGGRGWPQVLPYCRLESADIPDDLRSDKFPDWCPLPLFPDPQ